MRFIATITLGVCLAAALQAAPALAQAGVTTVEEIRIEGIQRIERETILSYMKVRIGDPFDPERLDQSLKDLFATGLFTDVTLRREGGALVVSVIENPIINRLAFEGNSKIKDEDLAQEVRLRPRIVYTRTRVQNDVKRILDLYRRSGRFAATVEPKVIPLPQNRVDLVFEINEGSVTRVRRISFIGNRVFSDSRLRGVIRTIESRWWRILTAEDTYDPDRLSLDRELLRRFYLSNGHADFRVASAVAELTPDRKDFFVTFTIEEGERYRFAKVDVATRIRGLDPETLRPLMTVEEGEWYDADQVEDTINNLTDEVGNRGYAFVEIRPQIQRNREDFTIDVSFNIEEGPRVFVERIDISGNTRTLDEVIRREVRLAEGDAFNTSKLHRSQTRIRNLGFFESVEVASVPGSAPDRTVINVEVEERSTGQVSVGAGYSTDLGGIGDFGVSEANLLGRGQELKAQFTLSQRTQEIDLSFTEPYFLDRDLSAGVDLFRITRDLGDESSFSQRTLGFALRMGYEIVDPLRQSLKYSLARDELTNIDQTTSVFIREQEGTSITSTLGQELLYDRRDNRFDPTEGYFIRFDNQFAGLGGSVRFVRNRLNGGTYIPLEEEWVLSFTMDAGLIFGLGQDVRVQDRFFLGGSSLRGFQIAGIGPRDASTGDSLGGNRFYAGTTELTFPIGLPKELGILGKLFTDFGSVGDSDSRGSGVLAEESLRASIGTGIAWSSPFGPIRIDFSVPILKESFDKEEVVRFSFGTRL